MSDYLHSKAPSKIIAVEEHFVTPLYRQQVAAGEFRKYFIASRSEQLGYDIPKELLDLGETRLRYMDESGIDVQLLSFGQPGAQGFGTLTARRSERFENAAFRKVDMEQKVPVAGMP